MDPASAILTFISTGVQAIKLAKETFDDIKNAPKELQVLRERVADVEMTLDELRLCRLNEIFQSEEDSVALARIRGRADSCIDEISKFTGKMQKLSKDGAVVVDKVKWITMGNRLKDLTTQLDRLESALNAVMNSTNLYVL